MTSEEYQARVSALVDASLPLADAGLDFVADLKKKGYSQAEVILILCAAIASVAITMQTPELLKDSVSNLAVLALRKLPTVQ